MAVYAVEGKLGTGKTKFAVWRAQLALRDGRRVAGNVDLHLDRLAPGKRRSSYVRLPDKPTADDLAALGHGNPDSYDEDRNGVLLLDELATWLNARSFQDRSRAGLLDWLVHARKLGWDVYLIVQDAGMIDRQVRDALIEYSARCLRLDRVRLPFVGGLLNDLFGGRVGYLPRMHLVAARIGSGPTAVVVERWTYRGDWLHACYDTRQVFRADYPHGTHTVLHPDWFSDAPEPRPWWRRLVAGAQGRTRERPPLRERPPAVAALSALDRDAAWRAAVRLAREGS